MNDTWSYFNVFAPFQPQIQKAPFSANSALSIEVFDRQAHVKGAPEPAVWPLTFSALIASAAFAQFKEVLNLSMTSVTAVSLQASGAFAQIEATLAFDRAARHTAAVFGLANPTAGAYPFMGASHAPESAVSPFSFFVRFNPAWSVVAEPHTPVTFWGMPLKPALGQGYMPQIPSAKPTNTVLALHSGSFSQKAPASTEVFAAWSNVLTPYLWL